LLRDKRITFIHENYNKIIYATLLLSWLLFGLTFTVWFFVIGSLMSLHADGLVNTFGHVPAAGYRNFDNKDASTNVWWIGYFHWGSGWHNNHHHCQSSCRQGIYWWEIDITYLTLLVLAKLGLVWDLRPVPARVYAQAAGAPRPSRPGLTRD